MVHFHAWIIIKATIIIRERAMSKKVATLENPSRRKAVKTIVSGVAAVAAYNVLPSKWGTPIIEQVFLPAHAATSGDVPAAPAAPAPAAPAPANPVITFTNNMAGDTVGIQYVNISGVNSVLTLNPGENQDQRKTDG